MDPITKLQEKLSELRTQLAGIEDEIRAVDVEADDYNETTDPLFARSDELMTEIETVEERKTKLEKIKRAARVTDNVHPQVSDDPLGEGDGETRAARDKRLWDLDSLRTAGDGELRSRAVEAVERVSGLADSRKQAVTEMLERFDGDDDPGASKVYRHVVATSNPQYMRAFGRAAKNVIRGMMIDPTDAAVLSRAMSLTDAAGGYAVPLPVDPTLNITGDGSANPFRQIGRVVPITTDVLRTVNAGATSFSWDGEAAEVSDDASTFANIDITAHKAQGFIPFSIEIGQDYPNFTADLGRVMAEGRDNLEAAAFATGTGSSQPVGIVTALTGGSSEYSSASTDTFAAVDVYTAEDTLGDKWLPNASFVANKAIFNDIRQFATDDGHSLWERIGAGQPAELLGYPSYRASGMDGSITATSDNYVLILGDFSNYVIANRIGFSVELVPHLFATANNRPSGQRGLYGYWRVGADSVNDDAFAMLNVT